MEEAMAVSTAQKKATAKAPGPKDNVDAIRQGYYDRIGAYDMAPLWEVLKGLVVTEPKSVAAPKVWHYKDVRPLIAEAGELITAHGAGRPVLGAGEPPLPGPPT